MKISDLFYPGSIALNSAPQDKAAALEALVQQHQAAGNLEDIDRYRQDILARDQDVPLPRNPYTDPSYMQNVVDHEYGLYTDLAKKAREQAGFLNEVRQFGANQGVIKDTDTHSVK